MATAHRLYLYDLPEQEQMLLRRILLMLSASGLVTDTDVNTNVGFSVRYVRGLTKSEARTSLADVNKSGKITRGVIPHSKWVSIYKYCMGPLFDQLEALGPENADATQIISKIKELQEISRASGRYKYDMHFFNQDVIRRDTASINVDKRFRDVFVNFRYSSDGKHIVFAATRIMRERDRDMFVSLIMGGHNQRETRGYAYELKGHLFLHGFIEEDGGGETFSLQWTDANANILYGVMTTIGNAEMPHAKECIFIRATALRGGDKFLPSTILTELNNADALRANTELVNLRAVAKACISDDGGKILLRSEREYIELARFLKRDILHAIPPEITSE